MSSASLQYSANNPVGVERVEMGSTQTSKHELASDSKFSLSGCVRKQNNRFIRCIRVAPTNTDQDAHCKNNLYTTNCSENRNEACFRSSNCCGGEIAVLRKLVTLLFLTSVVTLVLLLMLITGKIKTVSANCSCNSSNSEQEGGLIFIFIIIRNSFLQPKFTIDFYV